MLAIEEATVATGTTSLPGLTAYLLVLVDTYRGAVSDLGVGN
jgi:hypothetical protein